MTRAQAGKVRLAKALMVEYYRQRSSAGLLITEATTISSQANGWNEFPGMNTVKMLNAWKQGTDAVYAEGTPIFLQLWHMGRASHSSFHDSELPVVPDEAFAMHTFLHQDEFLYSMKSAIDWGLDWLPPDSAASAGVEDDSNVYPPSRVGHNLGNR
jgi:2,4-dienoyl-CoA reductase-like NADH-dependent reductase (Old Yellow Enzyme family)